MLFRSDGTEGHDSGKKVSAEEVKAEWSFLWRNRIDDKVRAESIAKRDYSLLFVDQGTVIFATKNFKKLNLRAILSSHGLLSSEGFDSISPSVGGYGKFARTILNKQKRYRKRKNIKQIRQEKSSKKQLKKSGGRGWLNNFC